MHGVRDIAPQAKTHFLVIPKIRAGLTQLSKANEDDKESCGIDAADEACAKQGAATRWGRKMLGRNDGRHREVQVRARKDVHRRGSGHQVSWPARISAAKRAECVTCVYYKSSATSPGHSGQQSIPSTHHSCRPRSVLDHRAPAGSQTPGRAAMAAARRAVTSAEDCLASRTSCSAACTIAGTLHQHVLVRLAVQTRVFQLDDRRASTRGGGPYPPAPQARARCDRGPSCATRTCGSPGASAASSPAPPRTPRRGCTRQTPPRSGDHPASSSRGNARGALGL